jgi:hypothetical protein
MDFRASLLLGFFIVFPICFQGFHWLQGLSFGAAVSITNDTAVTVVTIVTDVLSAASHQTVFPASFQPYHVELLPLDFLIALRPPPRPPRALSGS